MSRIGHFMSDSELVFIIKDTPYGHSHLYSILASGQKKSPAQADDSKY